MAKKKKKLCIIFICEFLAVFWYIKQPSWPSCQSFVLRPA